MFFYCETGDRNPDFDYTEFGTIRNVVGSNNFVLLVKQYKVN